MPWPLARDFAAAVARLKHEAMLEASAAARAAQADEKGWRAWVMSIVPRP